MEQGWAVSLLLTRAIFTVQFSKKTAILGNISTITVYSVSNIGKY